MGRHQKDKCEDKCDVVLEAKKAKIYKLKAKKSCIRDITSKNIETGTLEINNINVGNIIGAQASTGQTSDLDPVTCDPDSILGEFTPKYLPSYNVDETVFNLMLKTASEAVNSKPEGLQARLTRGRERLGLEGPSKVQLRGSISFAPWLLSYPEDASLAEFINFNTNVGWNLRCANTRTYREGGAPNPAVVSVYIQYGYIDKITGVCKCELVDLGAVQFNPTLDYKEGSDPSTTENWGEQFTGKKVLDTTIVQLMRDNMPDPQKTGGVQVLFFAEEQIEILNLNSCDENRANTSVTTCGNNCTINTGQTNVVNTTAGLRVARTL